MLLPSPQRRPPFIPPPALLAASAVGDISTVQTLLSGGCPASPPMGIAIGAAAGLFMGQQPMDFAGSDPVSVCLMDGCSCSRPSSTFTITSLCHRYYHGRLRNHPHHRHRHATLTTASTIIATMSTKVSPYKTMQCKLFDSTHCITHPTSSSRHRCTNDIAFRPKVMLAACARHNQILKMLVGAGFPVDAADKEGRTPLHRVCMEGVSASTLQCTCSRAIGCIRIMALCHRTVSWSCAMGPLCTAAGLAQAC